MIDIKQHIFALQFKSVVKLFDNNYSFARKTLENLCIEENLFFCILRSNIKLTKMLIVTLAFLRFICASLSTLKTVVNVLKIPSGNNFLWLNKTVKCQNKPMLIEEFNAGIFDFQQLLESDGKIK